MRFALVSHSPWLGGSERCLRLSARAGQERGLATSSAERQAAAIVAVARRVTT